MMGFLKRKSQHQDANVNIERLVETQRAPSAIKTQLRLRRLLQQKQTADFYYLIDIVGTCNLRCPSCPVGNYADTQPKGLMSLDMYQAILQKISLEHPGERIFIDLYNWGEPGLHKQLGDIIRITKSHHFGVGISTNLNVFPDMKAMVKAAPSYLRISLSGYFNTTYQQTHRRGDINLVKSNMHLLRYWLDHFKSDTIVQVGFHIYRDNFDVDFPKMQVLCDDLGFIFAPTLAALMPAEKAIKEIDGEPLPNDETILSKLVISTTKRVDILGEARKKHRDCQYRSVRTTINFDGSVPLCCATFEEAQIIAKNFLDISRQDIQANKYAHSFCKKCQARSLDLVYTGAAPHLVEEQAVSVLGKKYETFLKDWNVSLDPVVEWEEKELTAQEAYDLAMQFIANSAPLEAIKLLLGLITSFPKHGEGLFQLGILYEKAQDYLNAEKFYKAAINVWPNHPPYLDAFSRLHKVVYEH